jgi:hypothetical protein
MALSDAAKKAKAAYLKEWKRKHPEKQRQYVEAYWERRAAEMATGKKGKAAPPAD